MAHVASLTLVRQIGVLFEGGSAAGLSDRQLLERFIARHDPAGEAAFSAIVARHGPMVLGVCRQLLGDHHHAEDAFQAVFLVLACQARSIRDPDLLGAWLYGVALRTARKARGRLARRRRTEENAASRRSDTSPNTPAEQAMLDREEAEALHGEIDRLPESFRLAVVYCYFEGLSPDEAAERLRWPSGTLRSRLVRARRAAAPRPQPPRDRTFGDGAGRGTWATIGVGVHSAPALRYDDPGGDPVRGQSRRRRCPLGSRRGLGPGGPRRHAVAQA